MLPAQSKINVLVLMAVKNGLPYLPEQLDSILSQNNCHVNILISDDQSTDGSLEYANKRAQIGNNIRVLSTTQSFGSPAKNFHHLIINADVRHYDYVAFSDQDDIWLPDKLFRHSQLAVDHKAEGVSSNVTAFWPNGYERLLNKAQAQNEYDFLFESAGPGCTFLMTPWLVNQVKSTLLDSESPAKETALHDWLVYAVCRAYGRNWMIDTQPTVKYRQHSKNVVGANIGLQALWTRLTWLKQRWYRKEVNKIAQTCYNISGNGFYKQFIFFLNSSDLNARIKLMCLVPKFRRKTIDGALLFLAILVGLL